MSDRDGEAILNFVYKNLSLPVGRKILNSVGVAATQDEVKSKLAAMPHKPECWLFKNPKDDISKCSCDVKSLMDMFNVNN